MTYFSRLPRYWLTRLYCALSAATNVIVSVEPRSLTAQVLSATGGATTGTAGSNATGYGGGGGGGGAGATTTGNGGNGTGGYILILEYGNV